MPAVMRGIATLLNSKGRLTKDRKATQSGRVYITLHGLLASIRELNGDSVGERSLESVVMEYSVSSEPVIHDGLKFFELDVKARAVLFPALGDKNASCFQSAIISKALIS